MCIIILMNQLEIGEGTEQVDWETPNYIAEAADAVIEDSVDQVADVARENVPDKEIADAAEEEKELDGKPYDEKRLRSAPYWARDFYLG